MVNKRETEVVDNYQILRTLITKTIIDYCMKSEEPVNITHIVKALSDVLAAHMATMTEGWTVAQKENCINMIFNSIANTMKDCEKGIEESKSAN